jgi:hypothetical protein
VQPVEEGRERRRVGPQLGVAVVQVARELQADLGEDLAVAARDGVAGELEAVEGRVRAATAAARHE